MTKYNVIFTGGSVRGLCYAGVLKALEEKNIQIKTYTGSSIGSLMIVFYALGYSADEIEEEINKLNMPKLFTDFNFNMFSNLAVSRGEKYLNWLREKIEQKFYGRNYKKSKMPPVCFKDIDKDIYVTALELETSQVKVFSKYTTPEFEIAKALRASSAMPFLLPPFKYEGKNLIDGDIARGCPIFKVIPKLQNDNILEFRITGGSKNKISKNPVKMVNSIINSTAYIIDNQASIDYKTDKINIIKIDVEGVSFTDFFLTNKKKKEIYKIGYETTKEYLKEIFNEKF